MNPSTIAVILNPASGAGKTRKLIPPVTNALTRLARPFSLHVTSRAGEAPDVARRAAAPIRPPVPATLGLSAGSVSWIRLAGPVRATQLRTRAPVASASKPMKCAGVWSASIVIRLAAGWMRC